MRHGQSLCLVYAIPLTLALFLSLTSAAQADEVRFKDRTIFGTVTNISSAGVALDTGYGVVTIPLAEIETIKTDKLVYVIHGDDGETSGKILGVEGGELLVGDDVASATRIALSTVRDVDNQQEAESFPGRMRNRFRYWKASLDVGFTYSNDTEEETDLLLGLTVERRKKPTRLVAKLNYTFGVDRDKGESSNKTDNEIHGKLKGEYDLTERFFLQALQDAEYDEIDRISIRWVGIAGPGYRLIHTEEHRFQVETGGGYVYQRFFGGDSNEYTTIGFAVEGSSKLPFGLEFEYNSGYLPSLKDWVRDYLILSSASLALPIHKYLALKATLSNTYDNTPDPNAAKNELQTFLALSWRF